jgi:hypothetical protein
MMRAGCVGVEHTKGAFSVVLKLVPALGMALLLVSCAPGANTPGQVGQAAQNAMAGKPPNLAKLSQFDHASYVDVLPGPDKTIHVLYEEKPASKDVFQVYYRASTDGGKSWSDAVNLSEVDPKRQAGTIRLGLDGQNRLYAFWKAFTQDLIVKEPIVSTADGGSLVYRVLDKGTWSALAQIGNANAVHAWFPAGTASGQVNVVWSETTVVQPEVGGPVPAGRGELYQGAVNGTAATAKLLFSGKRLTNAVGTVIADSYDSLQGVVDPQGTVRFVAQKSAAATPYAPDIVYWDGTSEKVLWPLSQTSKLNNPNVNPAPRLLVDEQGRDHVIYWDQMADHPAVVDHPIGAGAPTTLFRTNDVKGQLLNLEAYGGPHGAMIALVGASDTGESAPDLSIMVYSGGTWGKPVNLTNNAALTSLKSAETDPTNGANVAQLITYSPVFASAGFDPDGHIDIAMINSADVQTSALTPTAATSFTTNKPNAFFIKF